MRPLMPASKPFSARNPISLKSARTPPMSNTMLRIMAVCPFPAPPPFRSMVGMPIARRSFLHEPEHRAVEFPGFSVRDEMIALDEHQAAVRDALCDQTGMGGADHVPRSGDDQRLRADGRQLFGRYVRVVHHEAQHLRVAPRGVVPSGERLRDPVPDLDGELDGPLHSARVQVGAVQDQPADPLRMPHSEDESDVPSVREPEQVRTSDPVLIHEAQKILRELPYRKGTVAPGRLPVSPGVRGIDVEALSERVDLSAEVFAVFPVSVQEDHLLAASLFQIEMPDVHVCLSVLFGSRSGVPENTIAGIGSGMQRLYVKKGGATAASLRMKAKPAVFLRDPTGYRCYLRTVSCIMVKKVGEWSSCAIPPAARLSGG